MTYVDAHCHIFKEYYSNPELIIEACKEVHMLVTGTNLLTNKEILALKQTNVDIAMGAYPIDLLNGLNITDVLEQIEENINEIVAVGEIGLDLHHATRESLPQQIEHITKLVKLANKYQKPVVVHSRKAEKEVIELLPKIATVPVLNHCFSGRKNLVKKGVEAGMYFSIPSNVVHSTHFQTLVKIIPITQLLTETDSPYLWKEFPNTPNTVKHSIKKIAEIKGMKEDDVKQQIYQNYCRIFKTHKK